MTSCGRALTFGQDGDLSSVLNCNPHAAESLFFSAD